MTQPDLVIACYGINCGIYQPFDEDRFQKYQQGIANLKEQTESVGAEIIFVTPPTFDDQRAKKPFSYDNVMARYTRWLLSKRAAGWQVIDLHGPMARELAQRRKENRAFTFQPDGVHPNQDGHRFIASCLIAAFDDKGKRDSNGVDSSKRNAGSSEDAVFKAISERLNLRRDAYLTAAKHNRPGIRKGLPLEDAERRAAKLTKRIQELLKVGD